MKLNFRKISALASSALMLGMTAGIAAAANFPAPFVSNGVPNVAIVYGSGAAPSDGLAATSINTALSAYVTGGSGGTVSGGESFQFVKQSTKFQLGNNITGVYSSDIDDDELPTLLADGVFVDDDNDEFDFTQKVVVDSSLQLGMFEDNDYAEDEPTVGFRIASGTTVLTYTLDFTEEPEIIDTVTADLSMMGKTYYVLSNSSSGNNKILTLLDSAEEAVLDEGTTATVAGHSVVVTYISSTEVKLTIDGQTTNSLAEAQTQKLADGSYVGIKDILFNSKQGTISSVEFSIGTGKLKLTSGSDIEINDDTVTGMKATITNDSTGSKLSKIDLEWKADDDLFVTPTSEITMPGFGAVKLSFGGLTYPVEETIEVAQGATLYASLENFPIKNTEENIPFLYGTTAGSFSGIGKDADSVLRTAENAKNVSFDGDTDEWFVASWSDGSDAESYLMRLANFALDGTDNITDFQYRKDGVWTTFKEDVKNGDTFSLNNVDLGVVSINRLDKTASVGNTSSNVNFNTVYSVEGLKVYLPVSVNTSLADDIPGGINFSVNGQTPPSAGHNATSFFLHMVEENKDDDKAAGDYINATVAWTGGTDNEVTISAIDTTNTDAASTEIGDTDVFRDFTYSALATEILWDKPSADADSVKLMYHGSEVTANVFITSPEASVSGGGGLGDVRVTDSQVSTVSSRNLVVVGGSCINSAAAALVGGAYCGSAWTSATGVGAGQFLIKKYSSGIAGNSFALLVAGYNAEDTTNAATYLRTKTVDTNTGGIGTTSTAALTAFS